MTETAHTQPNFLHDQAAAYNTGPVTCLGMEFPNDEARRAFFTERLREHLQVPALRATEGFPIGSDEDILALSDPPYYTACPNPFLPQIIAEWNVGRFAKSPYQREPFAADVSEGKNDPIYNAHSYHTKVPHKAIMRYILHYTEPGDIVFDGFCGSGMTGVAAQLCGDRKAVQELGYTVDDTGAIYDGGQRISRLGARKAVLNDLSPAATFIAYNYNTPVDVVAFEREARRILDEVEAELGWMYETWHPNCEDPNRVKARINYTIWSEVFICQSCSSEIVFWEAAIDKEIGMVKNEFPCPNCGAVNKKTGMQRANETYFDWALARPNTRNKHQPVLINYSYGNSRLNKQLDAEDWSKLDAIERLNVTNGVPIIKMMFREGVWGEQWRKGYHEFVTHAHQFYTWRNLHALTALWKEITASANKDTLMFCFTASLRAVTKLASIAFSYYFNGGGGPINSGTKGTLYISSTIPEVNVFQTLQARENTLVRLFRESAICDISFPNIATSTCSSGSLGEIPENSIDYIFVDPPFGSNLMYSELNFLWETWLKVFTNNAPEAIVSSFHSKSLPAYQSIMVGSFLTFFRILRPGHWMTVEFHNSQNSVWNSIQEAILRAGFVIGDVRVIDKQQGSFNQYTAKQAVRQDLVISAYKPGYEFDRMFLSAVGTANSVWIFVQQHLRQIPVLVRRANSLETIAERQNYLLFDRMVAYHIQRGMAVPIGSAQFYAGLKQRFVERDGMFFLPDQVPEYDRARMEADTVAQIALFVSDEKSTLTWLRVQLGETPQTFQEIQPRFLQELHQARHEELPDLRVLLEENFLQDEAGHWYVPDPHRAEDLEKLRLRGLLREFETYKEGRKKLTLFRSEAMRAGFSQAWRDKEYQTIVQVAERLPESVLQEDPDLLMYYDNASLRT